MGRGSVVCWCLTRNSLVTICSACSTPDFSRFCRCAAVGLRAAKLPCSPKTSLVAARQTPPFIRVTLSQRKSKAQEKITSSGSKDLGVFRLPGHRVERTPSRLQTFQDFGSTRRNEQARHRGRSLRDFPAHALRCSCREGCRWRATGRSQTQARPSAA